MQYENLPYEVCVKYRKVVSPFKKVNTFLFRPSPEVQEGQKKSGPYLINLKHE